MPTNPMTSQDIITSVLNQDSYKDLSSMVQNPAIKNIFDTYTGLLLNDPNTLNMVGQVNNVNIPEMTKSLGSKLQNSLTNQIAQQRQLDSEYASGISRSLFDSFVNDVNTASNNKIKQDKINHQKEQIEKLTLMGAPASVIENAIKKQEDLLGMNEPAKNTSSTGSNAEKIVQQTAEQAHQEALNRLPYIDPSQEDYSADARNSILTPGALETKHLMMQQTMQDYAKNLQATSNVAGISFNDLEAVDDIGDNLNELAKFIVKRRNRYTDLSKLSTEDSKEFNELANGLEDVIKNTYSAAQKQGLGMTYKDIALAYLAVSNSNNHGLGELPLFDKEGKLMDNFEAIHLARSQWDLGKKYLQEYDMYDNAYKQAVAARDQVIQHQRAYDKFGSSNSPNKAHAEKVFKAAGADLDYYGKIYSNTAKSLYNGLTGSRFKKQ